MGIASSTPLLPHKPFIMNSMCSLLWSRSVCLDQLSVCIYRLDSAGGHWEWTSIGLVAAAKLLPLMDSRFCLASISPYIVLCLHSFLFSVLKVSMYRVIHHPQFPVMIYTTIVAMVMANWQHCIRCLIHVHICMFWCMGTVWCVCPCVSVCVCVCVCDMTQLVKLTHFGKFKRYRHFAEYIVITVYCTVIYSTLLW